MVVYHPRVSTSGDSMRVLLVEDDVVLADGISRVLRGYGMVVDVVHNGLDADAMLQRIEVTVAVVDIGVPGIDGFEIVRRLRTRGSALPVLLLTARDAIQDRVFGLETGADDYLVKPFATPELVARLKALSRRGRQREESELKLAGLTLDIASRRALAQGQPIDLSVREWAVLEYLVRHVSRVVSKQQIIDAIISWDEELTLNAVEVYISRIRAKIANTGVTIRTIRGFGYLLEAE